MSKPRFLSRNDHLWLAVFLSLLLHGLALVYFWPEAPTVRSETLEPEITLINYQTEATDLEAVLLAQWHAVGGGSADDDQVTSAPFTGQAVPSPDSLVLHALQERLRQAEAEQQQRLMQLEAEWQAQQAIPKADQSPNAEFDQEPSTEQLQLALELHALKDKLNQYNAKPRVHFEAPSAKASAFAAYVEAWRAKIEHLGTEHYPDQAKGQLSDALQMTVYIDQTGNLVKIDIHQPAQNPIFNVAAQRIVRLAAPYPAFSAEMRAQTDILAITRSWRFTKGNLKTD
ncbi:MAG TPA: TonB C-terminal domain-containing protein [Paenalcaligenes hominis]|uniref:Protein TonB n=1 Tax=Paenalcaligenes hominis TaxID=643674 RepID=A0A9D2VH09_9BURK|nr:TonB C-terminal domain-containing protein [Paenalcaligenes hominis]NJB65660.1 protein TonB [Paenalcaligenes hominis]GGE64048.1 transporter TonB [Paenalcaligenes hominis]HJH24673.1 TonB C-terminal domain-containing protein [Paenalcaligenes hominis]